MFRVQWQKLWLILIHSTRKNFYSLRNSAKTNGTRWCKITVSSRQREDTSISLSRSFLHILFYVFVSANLMKFPAVAMTINTSFSFIILKKMCTQVLPRRVVRHNVMCTSPNTFNIFSRASITSNNSSLNSNNCDLDRVAREHFLNF